MQSTFIDIAGQTFNELTAVECVDSKKRLWKWRCSCGEECIARKNDVTSGRKKSCGHLSNRGGATINIGDKFNEWTVLEDLGDRHFLCRCSCGEERSVHSYDLRKGNSKSCGHLSKGTGDNGKIDLKDQEFGEWKVLRYDDTPKKWGYWICRCSCGEERSVRGILLRNGQSKSCGHATNAFKDLKNQQFGDWTAIEFLGDYKWKCKCTCGTEREVSTYDLVNGKSTNCGCKRHIDISGRRFGKLKAVKYINNLTWECKCDCGNTTNVATGNLLNGGTKSCGCLAEDKKDDMLCKIKEAITEYNKTRSELPFYEDIALIANVSSATVKKYVIENELESLFNKHFRSKKEKDLYEYVKSLIPDDEVESCNRTILEGQELDIYIPSKKLAIEFNGTYWHSDIKKPDMYYHQNKTKDCVMKGIRLVHIFEYEWEDEIKQEKILKYIKRLITDEGLEKVYARKCEVRYIDGAIANEFADKYHLQNSASASVNIGCYYKNELVGIMTLGKPRFNSNYNFELIRLCWKENKAVIGGAEKMFKLFKSKYSKANVISYCDISKFNGKVYGKMGFKSLSVTSPNYVWVSADNDIVLSRYKTQKHLLVQMGLGKEDQTEDEIMTCNNFYKVYDCGNMKLECLA